ncbi:alpha/beta hydrolase [Rhizobium sp. FY34]|uniref:alpha/beta fold hydrolase n=1 Tax=Rhizobium sp. FY34 TaxID=2562309 RepID=UPI0010C01B03|nr:alpha/beta hydrolase [Rhizobium sp. FY34]
MTAAGLFVHRLPARSAPSSGCVLWVHGYTLDGTVWAPLWQFLPEFDHIAPDLPGHGQSRPFAGDETLPGLADGLLALAEAEAARTVVGMSFGGSIVLEAAIRAPRLFAAIVLAAPGLAGGPQDPEAATCNQELIRLAEQRGVGPWLSERWMSVPPGVFAGLSGRPALRRALAEIVGRHPWQELFQPVMRNLMARPQTTAEIAAIAGDILLLVGEDDMPAFLRCAELIRRSARQAQRSTIAGAAHLCLLEQPSMAADLIRKHLLPHCLRMTHGA